MKLSKSLLLLALVGTSTIVSAGPYVIMSYFANWGVYDNNHPVACIGTSASSQTCSNYQISGSYDKTSGQKTSYPLFNGQANALTMLDYAFFEGDPDNPGAITFSDTWADLGHGGGTGMGNFIAFSQLKNTYPTLKLIISVGGWAHGPTFTNAFSSPTKLNNFVGSVVSLFNQYPTLDGIDLDFEPLADSGGWTKSNVDGFIALVQALHIQLPNKIITMAAPASLADIQAIDTAAGTESGHWATLAQQLNYIDIMAYDFHGDFDGAGNPTDYQANLYADPQDPYPIKFSGDSAVQAYVQAGVPSQQLILGVPAYGRATSGVGNNNNGLFQPFSSTPTTDLTGGVESYHGIVSTWLGQAYKDYENQNAVGVWAYAPSQQTFVSYDNVNSIQAKTTYVIKHHLAGMMMWELRDDFSPTDPNDFDHASLLYHISEDLR